jgi:hypothetical protein
MRYQSFFYLTFDAGGGMNDSSGLFKTKQEAINSCLSELPDWDQKWESHSAHVWDIKNDEEVWINDDLEQQDII